MQFIILRGLPGSGKTTFARPLWGLIQGSEEFCADDCWDYDYVAEGFTVEGLKKAHAECQNRVKQAMALHTPVVILHNTNTTEREMETYLGMAKYYGYNITSLIVENRHGGQSVHNVPEETMRKMLNRFEVKL